jgi:hypothetical protein
VKAELEDTRRRYGVLDMAHRALKVQLGDAHAANARLEKQLEKALAQRPSSAAERELERKKEDSDKAKDDGSGADALQLREMKKRQTWCVRGSRSEPPETTPRRARVVCAEVGAL